MRIAVIGPLPPVRGGIAAHTKGMIEVLRTCGHDLLAIPYDRLYPQWIAGRRPGVGSASPASPSRGALDCLDPRTWLAAAAQMRAFGAELVVAQYWTPIAAAAIGVAISSVGAAKRIVVCHNVVPHETVPGASSAARWLLSHCDGTIFHSRHVMAQARALGCRRPHAIAQMPLLVGSGEQAARPPAELATAWADGSRLFVCVGHARRYKGLGVLAAAWKRAAPASDALLVIAGEPLGARRELRALGRLGPQVRVIPRYVDEAELTWLLYQAEAVLLPYTSASQSGLLPAALRLSRRVVASDAGGLGEAPSSSGRPVGLITVPTGDVAALAAKIAELSLPRAGSRDRAAGDGAMRQCFVPITAEERCESWGSFVSALFRLVDPSVGPVASNSGRPGASDNCVRFSVREPAEFAWYDARRAD